jgi:hypothetical protein
MYASELRTCGLGAVVVVLLGAGIGFCWHYFADTAGATAAASAVTPLQSLMCLVLHRRTLLLGRTLQLSMFPGFQTYPTPREWRWTFPMNRS